MNKLIWFGKIKSIHEGVNYWGLVVVLSMIKHGMF